jgi:hypothetical protein
MMIWLRVLMIALILGVAVPSAAVTYYDDSFEAPANLSGWDVSSNPQGNPSISTTQAFEGAQSVRGHYTGQSSGGAITRLNPSTDDLWTRTYYRTTAFTYDSIGTKHFNVGPGNNIRPDFWLMHIGSDRKFLLQAQIPAEACPSGPSNPHGNDQPYDFCMYFENVGSVTINDNQWYCIETHLKMNTPGVADGIVQLWVDGVQTINFTNRVLRGTAVSGPGGNSSQAQFTLLQLYVQHGIGDLFYDKFAVGNTRIGCTGPPPPTPPAAPTGLHFALLAAAAVTVAWLGYSRVGA